MNTILNRASWSGSWLAAAAILVSGAGVLRAAPPVPGTGVKISEVGDDFEDENWEYIYNNPKSTYDNDKNQRMPPGASENGRWFEGMKRGHPDVVKRVPTPANGLPGSKGSLLLRSLQTGIPGRPSFQMQQDDFIADVSSRLGGTIPVSRSPNVVVRVFLPPVATWEKRSGPHFAFRAAVETTISKQSKSMFFSSSRRENETYWPGLFIEFESKADGHDNNYAYFAIRADEMGTDFRGPQITTTGWWTLGMSFTPDGMVHYFAKSGVANLTSKDYITSQFPYGYRCERFDTFFFDVWNADDGRTWSTSMVIDDPTLYCAR